MEIPSIILNTCPAANPCELTKPTAPPCGAEAAHLPPRPTAESLCTRALAGRIRSGITEIAANDQPDWDAIKNTGLAWLNLEAALAATDDSEAAHFELASKHAIAAVDNPYSNFRETFSAALLQTYKPAFMERKKGRQPGDHELSAIRQGLGDIYDAAQTAPAHAAPAQHIRDALTNRQEHTPCLLSEGDRLGLNAKLVVMMFAARQGILLYPASRRESRASGDLLAQNHDGYTLEDGQKRMVKARAKGRSDASRQRTGGVGYDEGTAYVNARSLIDNVLKNTFGGNRELYTSLLGENENQRPNIATVGNLLRAEIDGQQPGAASLLLLDSLAADLEHTLRPASAQ